MLEYTKHFDRYVSLFNSDKPASENIRIVASFDEGANRVITGQRNDDLTFEKYVSNVSTGAGFDFITFDGGANRVLTGDQRDRITLNEKSTVSLIDAGGGGDVLTINDDARIDKFLGRGGDDIVTINSDAQQGTFYLGQGRNVLTSEGRVEKAFGGADRDVFEFKDGGTAYGHHGRDKFTLGQGSDSMYGGGNNDRFYFDTDEAGGNDLIDGGANFDTLTFVVDDVFEAFEIIDDLDFFSTDGDTTRGLTFRDIEQITFETRDGNEITPLTLTPASEDGIVIIG